MPLVGEKWSLEIVLTIMLGFTCIASSAYAEEAMHHELPHHRLGLFVGGGFERDSHSHEESGTAIGLDYEIKFSDLKPHEARPIFKYAKRMTVVGEQLLLKDGEDNESLYLILEGECRVEKNGQDVATLAAGHFVGELSFLSGDVVSADVIASNQTRLMFWDKRSLAPLFKRQGLYESYFNSVCSLDVANKLRTMTAAGVSS